MLTIIYSPKGKLFSDFNLLEDAYAIVQQHLSEKNVIIETANSSFIEAIRVYVSRKEISHQDVKILFNEHEILLNEKVEFTSYPKGFMDHEQNMLREIVYRRIGKIV